MDALSKREGLLILRIDITHVVRKLSCMYNPMSTNIVLRARDWFREVMINSII
jgi:hypothetical protein